MSSKRAETTIRSTTGCKKAVRCVPSRYMQAAQASKASALRNTSVIASNSLFVKNENLDFSQAPWNQQDDSSGDHITSTPNSTRDLNIPIHEASVIAPNATHSAPVLKDHLFMPSAMKHRPKFHSDQHYARPSQPAQLPVNPIPKSGKEKSVGIKVCSPDYVQEIEVKNLYAMHLQAAYLESRARKSFQMRSQNALEQFYKIYCVTQILIQKIKSAESDLTVLSHLQLLQQLLKPQEKILEIVSKEMPILLEHYHEISGAIDSVRSNLPLRDVHVSPDSNLKADLACLLAKCEAELENFFKCHTSEMIESANLSKLLLEIRNCIGDLEKETSRLNDLLLAVDEMSITESSLKIGEIMSVTANNLIN